MTFLSTLNNARKKSEMTESPPESAAANYSKS